ncbi:MAG: transposase [Deltaproteobacteria bacterium]|nr:transposase [Deltaproteobacteria bacterium]
MLGHREPQGDFFRPDYVLRDHVGEKSFHGLLARHGADWFPDGDFVALYRKGMFDLTDFRVDSSRGVARCPAGKRSIRRDAVTSNDPGWTTVFSRKDCSPCPLRAQCTKSRAAARAVRITEKTEAIWRLRRQQKTKRFRKRHRKRVVVKHRIGRMIQLGARQARYFGKAKTGFPIALIATVANLMLVAAVTGAASSAALPLALFVGMTFLGLQSLAEQKDPLKMAPSRPGL